MDTLKSSLITIFKLQNPLRILNNYFTYDIFKTNTHAKLDRDLFINLYLMEEKQYSKDDAFNMYQIISEEMKCGDSTELLENSVLNLIFKYANDRLKNENTNIKCIYKDLLKWNSTTLQLDQDIFCSAFMAYEDFHISRDYKRDNFDWDIVIKSNNVRLHNLLSSGIAENHYHLKGSAPTFNLSWISLMNDISCRKLEDINSNLDRLDKDLDGSENIQDLIAIAALIRLILFKVSMTDAKNMKEVEYFGNVRLFDILEDIVKAYNSNANMTKGIISIHSRDIQKLIDIYKNIYGTKFNFESHNVHVDYAIKKNEISTENYATKFFSGERALMYNCFMKILKRDELMMSTLDLFYAYIIIKNKFRCELVQSNKGFGFANFEEYQDRKTAFIKDGTLLKHEVESSAVISTIKNQNIVSLEARIIPKLIDEDTKEMIRKDDKKILSVVFRDKPNCWNDFKKNGQYLKLLKLSDTEQKILYGNISKVNKKKLNEKMFYVFHIPKIKDNSILEEKKEKFIYMRCRDYEHRNNVEKLAKSLARIRETSKDVASRILGIDVCANEISTRPEVYGQAYRFLKSHIPSPKVNTNEYDDIENEVKRLRATYHVGEDFLDVVDGLRAVDEAVTFLNLTHGDRLGHAVVLGIDTDTWYNTKYNKVLLAKQDILDNVAWLLVKIKEFRLHTDNGVVDILEGYFYKYFNQIFSDIEDENLSSVNVDVYMKAWKLRGNKPELYQYKDNEKNKVNELTFWDRNAKLKDSVSETDTMRTLYRLYHYNEDVKLRGFVKEVFKIEPFVKEVIKKVQMHMRQKIRQMNIGIECNPTSNVLINNFERYDKHPIINMYNRDLIRNETEEHNKYSQLFVSINTDDQGVFNTLLENEYALMAIALEKAKDDQGNPIYNQADIYSWLENIRRMGIEQSFAYKV